MDVADIVDFLMVFSLVCLLFILIRDFIFFVLHISTKAGIANKEPFKRDYLVSGFVPVILTRRRKKRVTPVISDKEKKTSYTSERNNQHSGGKYGH